MYDRRKKHPVLAGSTSSKKAIVSVQWLDVDPSSFTTVDCEATVTVWTLSGLAFSESSSSSPKCLPKGTEKTCVRAIQSGSYVLIYSKEDFMPLMIALNIKPAIPSRHPT